jgi:hypothetical protein
MFAEIKHEPAIAQLKIAAMLTDYYIALRA